MANTWPSSVFACFALLAAPAKAAYMPVPWVFTDPRHDPYNPLQYIASNTLTAIAICECLSWVGLVRLGCGSIQFSNTTVAFLGVGMLL